MFEFLRRYRSLDKVKRSVDDDNMADLLAALNSGGINNEQVLGTALCGCISADKYTMFHAIAREIENSGVPKSFFGNWSRTSPSPLHDACRAGHHETVNLLLNLGYSVNQKDEYSRTPLWTAIEWKSLPAIDIFLLRDDLKVNIRTGNSLPQFKYRNITVLLLASMVNDWHSVKAILKRHPDLDITDTVGRTPLHYAALFGNLDIIGALLSNGAGIHVLDKDDITPLYIACKQGHEDAAKLLLEKGAHIRYKREPSQQTEQGKSKQYKYHCLENWKHPLIIAIENGEEKIVELLIENGVCVCFELEDGRTPLSIACGKGTLRMVKELIKAGSDVNHMDSFKQTPIFMTLCFQHTYLNKICSSALMNSSDVMDDMKEDYKIMEYLIMQGAILDCRDQQGISFIDRATKTSRTMPTFLILKYGGKVHFNNKKVMEPSFSTHDTYILSKCDLNFKTKISSRNNHQMTDINNVDDIDERCIGNPLSLKDQCRICIRNEIKRKPGIEFYNGVQSLPLPRSIISFLLLDDLKHVLFRPENADSESIKPAFGNKFVRVLNSVVRQLNNNF